MGFDQYMREQAAGTALAGGTGSSISCVAAHDHQPAL